jgi:hypothetical protein
VLDPLIKELAVLEREGLDLMVDGENVNVKVVLGCITGDNLFLNGLLGFVESFTAHHPCRHCSEHRSCFQKRFLEDISLVRTVASYDDDIKKADVQSTGLKEPCALNQLVHFHAATNYMQDAMHDLLEGVCGYDMRLICKNLTELVSLEEMNRRMQCVNYGYHDLSNKPPVIRTLETEMLSFEAAEMWCFVRNFSVSIGPLIPRNSEMWLLYLQLRQILDIIFSPRVLLQDIELLQGLIAEYLEMRSSLFASEVLKNKHHHLVHYPRLMKLMGPIVHYWCMRFEQKHQRYKRLMHITNNFRNVPKTVATRHQHDVATMLLTGSSCDIIAGNGNQVMLCDLTDGNIIDQTLGGGCLFMEFYQCNSVTIRGTLYKCGCYLASGVDVETGMPEFVQLIEIFIRDQTVVIFFCEKLRTEFFDPHFHAWSVERNFPKKFIHVDPMLLTYFLPHSLHSITLEVGNAADPNCASSAVELSFITLRHQL